MKKFVSVILCSALCMSMFAMPAKPGARQFRQPDGTTVEAFVHGDEVFHYITDTEGNLLRHNAEGYLVNMNEKMTPAKVKARRAELSERRRLPQIGGSSTKTKGLIILVQFSDTKFQSENTKAAFNEMLNGDNYTYNGATGSVRQYYSDQSLGAFVPELVVYGPVTLSNGYAYYGENNAKGNDMRVGAMVAEACMAAVGEFSIDLSQFDLDDDGYVDFVDILYAGQGEADSEDENAVWPCEWDLYNSDYHSTLEIGGRTISTFSCHAELNGEGKRAGIGTACHELGHVFGLPDFYDYNYPTTGNWDIMDGGGYLNNGNTPPAFSGYERLFSGWAEPQVLNAAKDNIALDDLKDSQKIYIITETGQHNLSGTNPNPKNFYILENRQQTGWDKYLPGHGMLIWRIQYNSSWWNANTPNARPSDKQGVAIMPADGNVDHWKDSKGTVWTNGDDGDPFPGKYEVNDFRGLPAGWQLTDIKETSGKITFNLSKSNIKVPTVDNLPVSQNVGSNVVLALYMDENVPLCNDLYLVGNYTDPEWSLDPSVNTKFEALDGFDGWYFVDIPYKKGLEGKPIQMKDGALSWDYQSGDAGAWAKLGGEGTQTLDINPSYVSGEADISYPSAGAYVYQLKYFKGHKSPCTITTKHNYTIVLYQPDCAGSDYTPAICGDFNGWTKTAMTEGVDINGKKCFTITIKDEGGHSYKFREANDESQYWDNQIFHLEGNLWKEFDNFQLPASDKDITITHDFSDKTKYKYGLCTEVIGDEYDVKVTVTVPEGAPKAGVEILGTFNSWGDDSQTTMTNLGNNKYTATIKAKAADMFKFRQKGTWDNEIMKLTSNGWAALPDMLISDYWNPDDHTITMDLSGEIYQWKVPGSVETNEYTIIPNRGSVGYLEQYDQYVLWFAEYANDEDDAPSKQGVFRINTDNINGTFTLDDLDAEICYFAIALAPGDTLYSSALTSATLNVKKGEAYKIEGDDRKFADVTLKLTAVDKDGITYIVPETTFRTVFVGDKPVGEEEFDIKVTAYVPYGAPEAGVEILGTFSGWEDKAVLMTQSDAASNVFTATIRAKATDEFKLREAGTWNNEIMQLINNEWKAMPNLLISDYWDEKDHSITLHFDSKPYAWKANLGQQEEKPDYTIVLYIPECESADFKPAIIGTAVGNWQESIPMTAGKDNENNVIYTYVIVDGEAGSEFKFRQAGISDWSNEIQHLNDLGEWGNMGNLSLPESTQNMTLTFNFSNPAAYRWTLCEDKPEDELTFDYEPTEVTTIEAVMTYADFADYTSELGIVEFYMENDEHLVYLHINTPELDEQTGITAGTYPINDSKQPGTVLASPGGNDTQDYPSFLGTAFGESGGYTISYFLASGNVSLEIIEEGVRIVVDAKSHFGSTIKLTYEGPIKEYVPVAVENIEQHPVLDLDAPMFNVVGQKVDKTYRGIIIQKGTKFVLR